MDKDISIGEFPKCTEDDRAHREEFSSGALLWVTFLWARKKGDRKERGEALRRSKRLVISTGNAFRSLPSNEVIGGGAVNWGAEKNRIMTCAELGTDNSDPHKTRKTQKNSPVPETFVYVRFAGRRLPLAMDGFRETVFIFFCPFTGPGDGTSRGSFCSRLK